MTNRLTAVAVPSLLAVSLLFIGAPSKAQTPGNLSLSAPIDTYTGIAEAFPGQEEDITGTVTSAIESNGTTLPKASGVQTVILYDPAVFSISTTEGNGVGSTATTTYYTTILTQSPVTFTDSSTGLNYAGIIYDASQLTGTKTLGTSPTTNPFNFAMYNLTVNANAPTGPTTIYYTNVDFSEAYLSANATNIVAPDASPTPGGAGLTSESTWVPGIGNTTFNNGLVTVTIVPGPDSLALFALGAIPVLSLLRRRRRA